MRTCRFRTLAVLRWLQASTAGLNRFVRSLCKTNTALCLGRLNLRWGLVLPGQCRHVVLLGSAELRRHGGGAWRCARTVAKAARGSPTQLETKRLRSQSALVPCTVCFVAALGQCVHGSHVCVCLSVCLCVCPSVFLFVCVCVVLGFDFFLFLLVPVSA